MCGSWFLYLNSYLNQHSGIKTRLHPPFALETQFRGFRGHVGLQATLSVIYSGLATEVTHVPTACTAAGTPGCSGRLRCPDCSSCSCSSTAGRAGAGRADVCSLHCLQAGQALRAGAACPPRQVVSACESQPWLMSCCGLSCNLKMLPPTFVCTAPLPEVAETNTHSVISKIRPDVLVQTPGEGRLGWVSRRAACSNKPGEGGFHPTQGLEGICHSHLPAPCHALTGSCRGSLICPNPLPGPCTSWKGLSAHPTHHGDPLAPNTGEGVRQMHALML